MTGQRALTIVGACDVHGRPTTFRWATETKPAANASTSSTIEGDGLTVIPGLLDLQVNGALGNDLTTDPHSLWDVAATLPRFGVTAFLPTVVTSDPAVYREALHVLRQGPPPGWFGAQPLGWHFEGPMLSPRRKGAHPEQWLRLPTEVDYTTWTRSRGVCMVTLAPELPGAMMAIRDLTQAGVVVAVGHTETSAQEALAAHAAGARAITHLGNAMPPLAGRDPGPIGAALGSSDFVAGVIADGEHLDPYTLRLFWRCLGPDRFLAVSDATAGLGCSDGPARLGNHHVYVRDRTVRLANGTLAGSATPVVECLNHLRETTQCSLSHAVATATRTPARLLRDATRGHLGTGSRADAVLIDPSNGLQVIATIVNGRVVYDARA